MKEPGFFLRTEARMNRAAGAVGLRPGQLALGIVLVAAAAVILLVHTAIPGSGATPHYAVNVTGSVPHIQTVGQSVDATVDVQNLRASTPDLVIDMGGCTDHWVLDGVTLAGAEAPTSNGSYYDFGNLPAYRTAHIIVTLVPSAAGNHACEFHVWNGPLSGGAPQGDELADVTTTVAVNP